MKMKNVLLIENCAVDAILIKEALLQNGEHCAVNIVEDGFEAVLLVQNFLKENSDETPNLIIANQELVVINGENILSLMKAFIPVILLSSRSSKSPPEFIKETCCIVNKPLEVREFMGIFREIKNKWLTFVN